VTHKTKLPLLWHGWFCAVIACHFPVFSCAPHAGQAHLYGVCVAAFLLSKNQVPLAYFDFGVLAIIVLTYVFLLRPSMKTMAEKV
jgi:hypothetical protein